MREILVTNLDRDLAARAHVLAALLEYDGGAIEFDLPIEVMPEFGEVERPEYFQMWRAGGNPLERSPSLVLARRDLDPPGAGWASGEGRPVALPDGRPGRATLLRFVPRVDPAGGEGAPTVLLVRPDGVATRVARAEPTPPPEIELVVARGTEVVRSSLGRFIAGFVVGSLALFGAGLLLVRRAARSALRPVEDLARALSSIGAGSLERRLEPAATSELAPIVDTLNAALARLESAFERERRFNSSAAHELRTPIAELRTLAELGERWPSDPELAAAAFRDLGGLARQMERIVSALLQIARAESARDAGAAAGGPTPAREAAERVRAGLARRASERGLDLDVRVPENLSVDAEPVLLERVLANLLENAVEHSPPGGRVRVRAEARAGRSVRFTFANAAAPSIEARDLPRFFEPFWRADASHGDGPGHVGLGLTLVKALCESVGGEAAAELAHGEVVLRVDLPGAARDAADPAPSPAHADDSGRPHRPVMRAAQDVARSS